MVKLTEEQIKNLKKEFEAVDTDKSGTVDRKEMTEMFKKMKEATKQNFDVNEAVENIFKHFDVDNDGEISFDEYEMSVVPEDQVAQMKEQFKKIDTDKDGKINRKELTDMFKAMKIKEETIPGIVENIFKGFDTDNSGEIDFDEYVAFNS